MAPPAKEANAQDMAALEAPPPTNMPAPPLVGASGAEDGAAVGATELTPAGVGESSCKSRWDLTISSTSKKRGDSSAMAPTLAALEVGSYRGGKIRGGGREGKGKNSLEKIYTLAPAVNIK